MVSASCPLQALFFLLLNHLFMVNIDLSLAVLQPIINPLIDTIADRLAQKVVDVLATSAKKEPKFYSRKETAKILHITLPTLARLTKDGLITAKKVGNRILYDAEAIDAAVKENRIFKYKRAK